VLAKFPAGDLGPRGADSAVVALVVVGQDVRPALAGRAPDRPGLRSLQAKRLLHNAVAAPLDRRQDDLGVEVVRCGDDHQPALAEFVEGLEVGARVAFFRRSGLGVGKAVESPVGEEFLAAAHRRGTTARQRHAAEPPAAPFLKEGREDHLLGDHPPTDDHDRQANIQLSHSVAPLG